jgi:hypothetical protein
MKPWGEVNEATQQLCSRFGFGRGSQSRVCANKKTIFSYNIEVARPINWDDWVARSKVLLYAKKNPFFGKQALVFA